MRSLSPLIVQTDTAPRRSTEAAFVSLLAATLAIVIFHALTNADSQFVSAHAFVSADVATTARTFATEGVFHLHAVPVNNNPPISRDDAYTHWPPLLPILLSVCFRMFGVSERVAHLLMLGILIITAMLLFRLGQLWLGTIGGALSAYFWLTLPVVVQFGDLVAQQSLMTMFLVAAVLAFFQRRDKTGGALLFLGTLSSWEIALVAPGLLIAFHWVRELRRPAVAAAIGAGTGIICVAGLFLSNSPELALDTFRAASFYMGLSPVYSHAMNLQQIPISSGEQFHRMILNNVWMLGPLGLAAIAQIFAVRQKSSALIVSSLCAPWLIWSIAMRNHMARHHFEFLIAAPLVALALAWVATSDLRNIPSSRATLKTAALVVAAAFQILLLPKPRIADGYSPQGLVNYARAIRASTEPGAIIMAPLVSAVPLYYSERHIVRGVDSAASIASDLPIIRREFPGQPVYLAIPPLLEKNFAPVISAGHIVSSTPDAVILQF